MGNEKRRPMDAPCHAQPALVVSLVGRSSVELSIIGFACTLMVFAAIAEPRESPRPGSRRRVDPSSGTGWPSRRRGPIG